MARALSRFGGGARAFRACHESGPHGHTVSGGPADPGDGPGTRRGGAAGGDTLYEFTGVQGEESVLGVSMVLNLVIAGFFVFLGLAKLVLV